MGKRPYFRTETLSIYHDDMLTTDHVEDNSVDLIVTSPPYNLGMPYPTYRDQMTAAAYLSLARRVPEAFARRFLFLPVEKASSSWVVAFADPLDLTAVETAGWILRGEISPAVAPRGSLLLALDQCYPRGDRLTQVAQDSYFQSRHQPTQSSSFALRERLSLDTVESTDSIVTALLNEILSDAIRCRASSVHIESFEKRNRLCFRVDGRLKEVSPPAPQLMPQVVSRLKVLANLKIDEKRLPQDGSFGVTFHNRQIEIRVSLMPTPFGERAVLRVLDSQMMEPALMSLGFEAKPLRDFLRGIHCPQGLVLIVGPASSGKTTTLYAALRALQREGKSIVTLEDPPEYQLTGITQVQVYPQVGFSFSDGLRVILRQDPNVLMVGEIRDRPTAEVCLEAALSGHLTLSTLHSHDAASAIWRLVGMGLRRAALAEALVTVVSQRLVRRAGQGSRKTGQIGLFEVVPFNEQLSAMVLDESTTGATIRHATREMGVRSLWDSGMRKVQQGITSRREVERVLSTQEVNR